ncbi:hypothetical protein [Aeromicrobium ginsengisoli]|uniref:DUF1795 domain-containing protein n=1 Tax=Aeromicrobium ginsengisoli TaxID=363867 RepID=A0A5M4FAP2_9ACTN|nr:hypothetical protein [Aeromicrobium ginsengisoli]KAA1395453.1 hypothetical protein ESP70_014950 [Aeromicrobium ginsengisoli]
MKSLPRSVVVLVMIGLTLAGCGGGSSDGKASPKATAASKATAPSVKPADGKRMSGTGYSVAVPKGWGNPSQQIPGTEQTDLFAADLGDHDGFSSNFNVVRKAGVGTPDLDVLEEQLPDQLPKTQFTSVDVRDRSTIDGEQAMHISFDQTVDANKSVGEQYYVFHDDQIFVVTFSYGTNTSTAERVDTAESILASWKWDS